MVIEKPRTAKETMMDVLTDDWKTRGQIARELGKERFPDNWVIALFELNIDKLVEIEKEAANNREGFIWKYRLAQKD